MGLKDQEQEQIDLDEGQGAATETGAADTDTGETQDTASTGQSSGEHTEGADNGAAGDEEEVIVTIGSDASNPEDEDGKQDSTAIRQLRAANREKQQRLRELEQQIESLKQQHEPKAVAVGEKPTLEACDYDAEKFEAELLAWNQRKADAEAERKKQQEAEENARKDWQAKLDAYAKRKTELKVKDFEDAEETFKTSTTVTQQGIVLNGSDDPALLVAALGKNPKKLAELAAIKDPVKFAFAVAKLETQLKVTPRRAPPLPEKAVTGSGATSGTADTQLERLRAEADRTGDRSKVAAYLRQRRNAA